MGNDRDDFVKAAVLVAAVQFASNLRSEVAEEIGHGDEAATDNARGNLRRPGEREHKHSEEESATYVHKATGKR